MLGEGFEEKEIAFEAEAVIEAGDDRRTVQSPVEAQSAEQLRNGRLHGGPQAALGDAPRGLRHARIAIKERKLAGRSPEAALKGEREVYRNGASAPSKVYAADKLKPGNAAEGPAIIEAVDSTVVAPAGWTYSVDAYGNGVLERDS